MKEFTARHMALVTVGAFAVIIAVNIALAVFAVRTHPGLEVPNSYVASQEFDTKRAAQEALGWELDVMHRDDRLTIAFTKGGEAVFPSQVSATLGRRTTSREDRDLALERTEAGYSYPLENRTGDWLLLIRAVAEDGTVFERKVTL